MRVASGYQQPRSWLRSGDSLQPEAPPERRRVAGQASALSHGCWCAVRQAVPAGEPLKINLDHGDVYVMSEAAVQGKADGKYKIKHCAGNKEGVHWV